MKCPNCNKEFPDNREFCPYCGFKNEGQPKVETPSYVAPEAPEEATDPDIKPVYAVPQQAQSPIQQPMRVIEEPSSEQAEPATATSTVKEDAPQNKAVDVDEQIDRADAPQVYKEDAHNWNARVREHSQVSQSTQPQSVVETVQAESDAQDALSLAQFLAAQVAKGEMTPEGMVSVLSVINGDTKNIAEETVQAPKALTPSDFPEFSALYNDFMDREIGKGEFAEKLGVDRETLNTLIKQYEKPEENQTSQPSVPEKTEKAPEQTEVKEEKKKGLCRKKEKTQEQIEAEKLQNSEFYENTKPGVNDPLPPSPWIKITKIVLLILLIIIIILCVIYFL